MRLRFRLLYRANFIGLVWLGLNLQAAGDFAFHLFGLFFIFSAIVCLAAALLPVNDRGF
jgi:hypothetical protein